MRVLWVLSSPIGRMSELLGGSVTQSGTWIDAARVRLRTVRDEVKLGIAAPSTTDRLIVDDDGTAYYGVGGVRAVRGRRAPRSDLDAWASIVSRFRPDIVHVWGSEFANALDMMTAAEDVPVVLSAQGVIEVIARHRYGDLRLTEIMRGASLSEKVRSLGFYTRHRRLRRQVRYESDLVCQASGVIVDSDWTAAQYTWRCPDTPQYRWSMGVGAQYLTHQWSGERCESGRVFCIAGTGPYKGIHDAIEATSLVRRRFPDVKLVIPGSMVGKGGCENPYVAYLRRMVARYSLGENVEFLGQLAPTQMADEMLRSNIMIMPSCVENQSSTLWEALYLGLPCVSACAGSAHEVIRHGHNGMLYRYGEPETLAYYMMSLLESPAKASAMGAAAHSTMRVLHPVEDSGARLLCIYSAVLEGSDTGGQRG